MKNTIKKVFAFMGWVLFAVSLVVMFFVLKPSNTVDYRGYVKAVEHNEKDGCTYITSSMIFDENSSVIIKVPPKTRVKTVSGDKYSVDDIKVGDMIDLDYKGEIKGENSEITAKWIIVVPISPEASSSDAPKVTKAEIDKACNDFTALIKSLKVEEIDKLELSRSFPEEKTYNTTDKALIARWVTVLNKMDVTGKAFEAVSGLGYSLEFYVNSEKVSLGGFMLPYIYNDPYENGPPKTMCYVNNYNELAAEFDLLQDQMGYTPY